MTGFLFQNEVENWVKIRGKKVLKSEVFLKKPERF